MVDIMKSFLEKANTAYYAGAPIISDEEFDALSEQFNYFKLGTHSPRGLLHPFKMYSLQKFYDGDELPAYEDPVSTRKLDGAAICLVYFHGALTVAHSRGNGSRGEDVLNNIKHLVPNLLDCKYYPVLQVNCEIVAPKSIPNARNYAAGALNLKDPEEAKQRKLSVVAYEAVGPGFETYLKNLEWLTNQGFLTVLDTKFIDFPTDGEVIRENNTVLFERLGHTSKHPRGAYALKPPPSLVRTKLLSVEWQLGRTGVVSPVAILEPVLVGDAMVSRATLHNMDYIDALGLEIGCEVEIVRSGEIIPRIVRKVNETNL